MIQEQTSTILLNQKVWSSQRLKDAGPYHLSISFALPSLSFGLLNIASKRFEHLAHFELSRFFEPEDLSKSSINFFESIKDVRSGIQSVSCHVSNLIQTLIPKPLFDEDRAGELLSLTTDYTSDLQAFHNVVGNDGLTSVFAIDPALKSWIHDAFPTAKILHAASVLIAYGLTYLASSSGFKTTACFEGNLLHVVIFKDGKFHFYNQYRCESQGDATYYLLLSQEVNKIAPNDRSITLVGNHPSTSATKEYLKPYAIVDGPPSASVTSQAPELPLSAATDHFLLFNQHLCA